MPSLRKNPLLAFLTLLFLVSLACRVPESSTLTPTNLPTIQATTGVSSPTALIINTPRTTNSTPQPTAPPTLVVHRIAIHRIFGLAEFYDRTDLTRYIPRGVSYFVLVPVLDHYEDRLFAVGVYDHNRTQTDFADLSAAGYNTIRITLDGCTSGNTCLGEQDGHSLNPAYLDNISDLLSLAKANHLFVLLASQDLPSLGGYAALANQGVDASFAAGRNATLLTQAGIRASQQYWADLLGGMVSRQAPFDIILGWELLSEQYFQGDQPPFSLQSGWVNLANGKSYDMYMLAQKQALAVDGLRYYIDQLKRTILTYDPTALVTMGFLAPDLPNHWQVSDSRYTITSPLLEYSSLDFYDLHASPGTGLRLAEVAQNFGLNGHISKPVIMGEVGASTWSYPQVLEAAIDVQDWIATSCSQGFAGWLYSTYYPYPAGLSEASWGFMDDKGTLLNALSPKNQPDACAITVLPGRNLALNKPVQVSAALPNQTAEMAVDGNPSTQWSAGEYPAQWIEIDLGAPYSIGEIRLTVGQWPAGEVVHQLWLGANREAMQLVHKFSGNEYDFDVLNYIPASPLKNIRYVRVVTTESPSWVSWREIEVLAPFPATPTLTPPLTETPTP